MIVPLALTILFAVVGLGASIFYGLAACAVFDVKAEGKPLSWRIHQFWFNFLGSGVGWVATWFIVRRVWACLAISCPAELHWSDASLIAIAFVGITGHLPYAVAGVLGGVKELALKVAGLAK